MKPQMRTVRNSRRTGGRILECGRCHANAIAKFPEPDLVPDFPLPGGAFCFRKNVSPLTSRLQNGILKPCLSSGLGPSRRQIAMSSLPKPEIIFTHEGDLDGFVSGNLLQRLARSLFDCEVPIEPLSSSPWSTLKWFPKSAWVCDITFEDVIDRENWLIVDHHRTPSQPESATLVHDLDSSAAKLCYQLLRQHQPGNSSLDRLVELTDIGDLFQSEHADFVLATDYARLIKTYRFRSIQRLFENDLESMLDHPLLAVMASKREVEDPVGLAWSRERITEISSDIGYVAHAVGDLNHILHELLNDEGVPYTVLFSLAKNPNRPIALSIRSRNGQALAVAQSLNGGGHPNAAGAKLPGAINSFQNAVQFLIKHFHPEEPAEQDIGALFEHSKF